MANEPIRLLPPKFPRCSNFVWFSPDPPLQCVHHTEGLGTRLSMQIKKQSRPAWEWGYTVVFGNCLLWKNYTKVCLPTKKQWAPHHTSSYPPSWHVRSLLSGIYTNYTTTTTTTTHCHSCYNNLLSLQRYHNRITYKCISWKGNYIISVFNIQCLSRMIHSNKNKPLYLAPKSKAYFIPK